MFQLSGLHILLTYTCNYECDHCFVWGSPWQRGVLQYEELRDMLLQAVDTKTIREIWFEGGEPFLYFPLLAAGIRIANGLGFKTGVVSNAYWATSKADALTWLYPLKKAGLDEIDVSSDTFHGKSMVTQESLWVHAAAEALGLEVASISVEPPGKSREPEKWVPGEPLTGGDVMYRGRAAEVLTAPLPKQSWRNFTACPYEDLEDPGRLHVDPFGNLHLCQGIVIGNLFERPLQEILENFEPDQNAIVEALLSGGPAKLIKKFHPDIQPSFVDACHACYTARLAIRHQFPDILQPEPMYGFI